MTRTLRERPRSAPLAVVAGLAIAGGATLLGAALAGGDSEQAATARAQLERRKARVGRLACELARRPPRPRRLCASRHGARRGARKGASARRRGVAEED